MKKVFTILIALCLAAVLLPQPAAAQAADTEHQFTFVTDLADVLSGGQFVIVATYYEPGSHAMGSTLTLQADSRYRYELKPVMIRINNHWKINSDGFEPDPLAFTTSVDMSDVTVVGDNLPVWTFVPTDDGVSLYANGSYLAAGDYAFAPSTTPYSWKVVPGDHHGFVFNSQDTRQIWFTSASPQSYQVMTRGGSLGGMYLVDMLLFKLRGDHNYEAVVTAPTCTENGYTTYTCSCGDSYVAEEVPALDHDYVDGVCTRCGRTVTVPTLTGYSFSLSFEDEILVNFYYTAENTEDVVEQGMLVFYADPGAADFAKADDVYTGSVLSNNAFANTTRGIAAKEMGDERYYCAYAKLTDGTYAYSALYQYSPEKYAKGRIANSSNEELKSLCVAMLNYGAAAQEFFGYRTDDLMNAGLTAEQQALVADFDIALFEGAIPADSAKTGNFVQTETGFILRNASVSFEGAFAINYYLTPEFAVDGSMTLYVWDRETYEAVETLTVDNAAAQTMVQLSEKWFAAVSGIAPKDLDKTYYVAGIYTDAQGNSYCTGVIAYSLSRYCINNASGNMGELAQSAAMYGYHADQYFAD